MKKVISIFSVMMAFMTLMVFSSCKEDDPVDTPEFEWVEGQNIVDNVIQAEAAGGTFAIQWKMNVNDAQIEANSDAEWITVQASGSEQMSKFGDGVLEFTVAANTGAEREGRITLSFIHPEEMAHVVLTVRQAGGKDEDPDVPGKNEIVLEVSNVTMSTLDVLAMPSDQKMQYFVFVATEEYFEMNGMMEDDEAVVAADLSFLKRDAETYGETLAQTFKFYAHLGDFNSTLKGLMPQTRYVVYAYGVKLEGENLVRLTDVNRQMVSTMDFEKIPVQFDFTYDIDVTNVLMTVEAKDYDDYFYFDILEDCLDLEEAQNAGVQRWMQTIDMYQMFGYDNAMILEALCHKKSGSYQFALRGSKEYLGFAMAISEDCMPHSDVYGETFRTGDIASSDNVIDIQIKDIRDRRATVILTPSNNDPYVALLYDAYVVEGKTDEEILEMCLEFSQQPLTGAQEHEFTDLLPNSEYSMLCFGCESFTPTTKLFRKDFKTTELIVGTATISVSYDKYYDVEAVSELDQRFAEFVGVGDLFLPIVITTDPVDAEEFYYGAYSEEMLEEYGISNDDETLLQEIMGYGKGQTRNDAFVLNYGEHSFIVAAVADADGNLSRLWRSEILVMDKAGVSPAQEFVDKYGTPAGMPALRIPFAAESVEPVCVLGEAVESSARNAEVKVKASELDFSRMPRTIVR